MAGFQIKTMNWVRKPSAYESMTAWREKRKAAQEEFETMASATASAFGSAWSNQINGLGELAANAALKRITAEGEAKINAAKSSIDMTA